MSGILSALRFFCLILAFIVRYADRNLLSKSEVYVDGSDHFHGLAIQ